MPKVISDRERELTKQAMQRVCVDLIKHKGLRRITVADITKAAGLAKGSFYFYYSTKEELLYEVMREAEAEGFANFMKIDFNSGDFRQNVRQALYDIYLAPKSLALYITETDYEYLLRKFPAQLGQKTEDYLSQARELFGLSETDGGTFAYLTDALHYTASREEDYGRVSRNQSLETLVDTIADFIATKKTE